MAIGASAGGLAAFEAYKKEDMKSYPAEELPIVKGMKGTASHVDNLVVKRPNGSEILLEMFGTPVEYNEGQSWGSSLVTFFDITLALITILRVYSTEDRPYRKTMSKQDAVSEIKRNFGTQFDPLMAKIFLDKEESIGTLMIKADELMNANKLRNRN
ncbi:MAG: Sensory box protein [Clostridiales bacterium 38_11]|nr:MAG: Sensory box protein [Clostridiales bacterium 38_11]